MAADRAAGRSIAFANGCFDSCTSVTCATWRAPRREADRLIVGVNDDGGPRPEGAGPADASAGARAELVAALAGSTTWSSSQTRPPRACSTAPPDVHCKGTDYTVDSVPEREAVNDYGGRIAIVGDAKAHSTTELLNRLRG